ncbi:MAG: hypothetical protein DMG49_10700 [Acidobacteria bacterium]|nr:MAG: hypothetical protein DMG49_10700 [Acidobacteriota bacterium]
MLHESDRQWLRDKYPGLTPAGNEIVGTIEFQASYDRQHNRFFILRPGVSEPNDSVMVFLLDLLEPGLHFERAHR